MGESLSPDRVFDFPIDESHPAMNFFAPGRCQENLEYGYGLLVKKVITVSDVEVADGIAIGEIRPRVYVVEGQGQVMASQIVQVVNGLEQVGAHVEQGQQAIFGLISRSTYSSRPVHTWDGDTPCRFREETSGASVLSVLWQHYNASGASLNIAQECCFASESVVEKPIVETNEPKTARKEDGAPIIEDWVSEVMKNDVNNAKLMKNVINNAYSTARRPFNKIIAANNSNFNKRVNTVNDKNVNAARPNAVVNTARPKAVLSAVKGNKGNVVKASACWIIKKLMEDLLPSGGIPKEENYWERSHFGSLQKQLLAESNLWRRRLDIKESNRACLILYNSKAFREVVAQWLFDIDALTNSMNYKPVVGKEINLMSSPDAGFKPSGEEEKKDAEDPRNESGNSTERKDSEVPSTEEPRINQEKDDYINSTNNINTASDGNSTNNINVVSLTVNVAALEVMVVIQKHSMELPMITNLPELEDICLLQMMMMMISKSALFCMEGIMRRKTLLLSTIRDCEEVQTSLTEFTSDVKTASTPMETHKPLLKDADGEDVDEHLYRSMIGSLMYLTSSRPDIMFADLPFDLVAYTDSDYAGASLDRKSTTGVEVYMLPSLIVVGGALDPIINLLDYGIITNSNEKKLIQMIKIHIDQNVAYLLTKAFDVSIFEYLIARVLALETIKTNQALEIDSLKRRVKKLEKKKGSRTHRLGRLYKVGRSARVVSSKDKGLGAQEDASKQDEKIDEIGLICKEKEVDMLKWMLVLLKLLLTAEKQGELTIKEKPRLFVELMNKRKKNFARLRAEEQRRKPPTKAQKRNTMSTYLKIMAGYKHNQLKTKRFVDIQMLFDKEMKRVNTFVDMDTELVKDENVEAEVDYDQEEAEMKKHMEIVPDDEVAIDAIPLATKPPIIMLQNIDREDLETLWKLVKAKHGLTRPEEGYERVLWGDLKVMFEPDVENEVWRNLQGHKVTV
ncbi:ribonuclease H-like domain, reverse transcriptase, RNA-dependent DNA polymerase [Tanacetum coccineum]